MAVKLFKYKLVEEVTSWVFAIADVGHPDQSPLTGDQHVLEKIHDDHRTVQIDEVQEITVDHLKLQIRGE